MGHVKHCHWLDNSTFWILCLGINCLYLIIFNTVTTWTPAFIYFIFSVHALRELRADYSDCCKYCYSIFFMVTFSFMQVGCAAAWRGGQDAFSIFYPLCTAEVSWQMAEDRLAGMCGGTHAWSHSLGNRQRMPSSLLCHIWVWKTVKTTNVEQHFYRPAHIVFTD